MRLSKAIVIGATVLALAGVGAWLILPEKLPMDWAGKSQFCAAAKKFELSNQDHITGDERLAAARVLEQSSPEALKDEMHVLLSDLVPESEKHSHVSAEEFEEVTVKVGEFIERACGVNLPSIRT